MPTVNMHEAKTNLSRLVEAGAQGEQVVIAKSGRPVAKLVRVDAAEPPERLGFLVGQAHVPEDFDSMHAEEIAELFGAHE